MTQKEKKERAETKQQRFRQITEEMANLYSGYVCINSKLDGDEAEARLKLFDENGKAKTTEDWNKMMDIKAKIDPEALAYMSPEESLIYAVSMKNINWDKYMDQFDSSGRLSRQDKSFLTIVKSYLEKFDGTVAIGVALADSVPQIFLPLHRLFCLLEGFQSILEPPLRFFLICLTALPL